MLCLCYGCVRERSLATTPSGPGRSLDEAEQITW